MSDLIERVARAIRPTMWDSNEAARAAIREVAAWLEDRPLGWPPSSEGLIATMLRAQLEETK